MRSMRILSRLNVRQFTSKVFTVPLTCSSLFQFRRNKNDVNEQIPCKLIEKRFITSDTFYSKFEITDNYCLGVPLGQHIYVHSSIVGPNKQTGDSEFLAKRYTPISRIDDKGFFSLIVKVYRPNESFLRGGRVSQFMDNIKINEYINVSGPVGKMEYFGEGEMALKDTIKETWNRQKYKNIGFIAAGTGIAPIYQILLASHVNNDKSVKFSLIYANKSEEDIILRPELDEIYQKKNIDFNYLKVIKYLKNSQIGDWKGEIGEINENIIRSTLPTPGKDTIILICGRKEKTKSCIIPILKKIGYSEENIFIF